MDKERDKIGAAIGRIPSGCSILTVEHSGRSSGLLVSWLQQAAFEPPSISVCIKRGRPIAQLIEVSKRFLLNVVAEDPTAMFRHFGRGFTLEENAFSGLRIMPTEFGPMIESCIAHLGCRLIQRVAVGDHDLYLAEVVAGEIVDGSTPYCHLRSNGLSY